MAFTLLPLSPRHGVRRYLSFGVTSIADGGTIDTGLTAIDSAVVVHGASTVIGGTDSAFDATIRSVSAGTLTITIVARTTTPTLAAYATAANVYHVAVGR